MPRLQRSADQVSFEHATARRKIMRRFTVDRVDGERIAAGVAVLIPIECRHYGAMAGGTAGEGAVPSRLSAITLAGHPFECSGQPPAETY